MCASEELLWMLDGDLADAEAPPSAAKIQVTLAEILATVYGPRSPDIEKR